MAPGLSVATGEVLEYECRINLACGAYHGHCGRNTSRALTMRVRWLGWVQCHALVLAYGSWAWVWDSATHRSVNGTPRRMLRCLLGMTHTRTMQSARDYV